jgi:hypothetical protein
MWDLEYVNSILYNFSSDNVHLYVALFYYLLSSPLCLFHLLKFPDTFSLWVLLYYDQTDKKLSL